MKEMGKEIVRKLQSFQKASNGVLPRGVPIVTPAVVGTMNSHYRLGPKLGLPHMDHGEFSLV
jgi:hypothetical protein